MKIVSLGPLATGGFTWCPPSGGHAFAVIVKATFELLPGTARLAEVQDGLNELDNHWDDDERCSVYAPSDMVPFKERADVTLVGDAHAPTPAGARTVVTRLAVAGLDKKVAVFCERRLDDKGRIVEGEPFKRMALRYERAPGGKLTDNPVGVEPATKANRGEVLRKLPNLQLHGPKRRGRALPAGYGPIAPHWPSRRRLLRDAAKLFVGDGWREVELPAGLDATYFNDAPLDQRVDRIRSDERIVLENLHPRWPRLSTRLPGVTPRAVAMIDGAVLDVALTADSLWIDMTRGVCTVTWRGSVSIAAREATGRVVIALAQPGEELSADDVAARERPRELCPSSVRVAAGTAPDSARSWSGRDSDVGWLAQPVGCIDAQRPRMQTVDLASGGEDFHLAGSAPLPFIEPSPTETLLAHPDPSVPAVGEPPFVRRAPALGAPALGAPALGASVASKTLASAAPALLGVAPHPIAPPALPTTPTVAPPSTAAPSPWAGKLAAAHHEPTPPRTTDRDSVTPPPLMLVPPPAPSSAPPPPVDDLLAPLDKRHRVEVLGYEQRELERVRKTWTLEDDEHGVERLDRELREAFGSSPSLEPEQAERHLMRVMRTHGASGVQAMREAMMDAVDEDGVFDAPLVLAHGTLRPTFDPIEVLRATIGSVATYLHDHEPLRREVESARDILATQPIAPDAAEELTERIRRTFDDAVDVAKVDQRVERMLLEGRSFLRKHVLKGRFVRAELTVGGETMPCYLSERVARALPLFDELPVRAIAELQPRQDQLEPSPRALRVIALGRVVARHKEC